jgi:single-strand DNA-binding protein
MGNFNKVMLLGNLTRDPEVRSLQSGQTVTQLGMAISRTFTVGGPGGEKKEDVTFVDVDFWARRGEVVAQYFHKGDPIFVEGRLNFRSWEDKDGNKRSKLSVTGENFEFVSSRASSGGGGGGGGGGGYSRGDDRGVQGQGQGQSQGQGQGQEMEGFDEVPF